MELKEICRVINGKKYQYYDLGKGDTTLVLLHGAGVSKDIMLYKYFLEQDKYRLIIPDLPGHNGLSFDDIYSVADFAHYLNPLISSLNLKKYFVIGFSLGGLVAYKYYEEYCSKDKVLAGFVSWASPFSGLTKKTQVLSRLLLKPRSQKVLDKLSSNAAKVQSFLRLIRFELSDVEVKGFLDMSIERLSAILGIIEKGTYDFSKVKNGLFIFGTKDVFVPLKTYLFVKSKIGETCKCVLIPNGGHGMTKGGKEKALESINNFLLLRHSGDRRESRIDPRMTIDFLPFAPRSTGYIMLPL